MPGILVNQAKLIMLDTRLAEPPFDDAELGLFEGAYVPVVTTVLGSLTEAAGTGYARQPITGWLPAVLRGDNRAFSSADELVFTNSGGIDWTEVTGWFWYSPGAAVLIEAGRFSLPWVLPAGDDYPTTPTHTLTGE